MKKYDLAVIGSGPCGYVAAIRAAQSGLKVCIFEKDDIGGVCLNWGCIPTKSLFASSTALYNIERASEFGIDVKGFELDFLKVNERKEMLVKKLASGIEMLMKARKIDILRGPAQLKSKDIVVSGADEVEAANILIATGSLPFELPGMSFDGRHILSSTDMLGLEEIPGDIVIVGGGVIGCEFASIFRAFGSRITIIEMMEQLLPNEDEEIAKEMLRSFKKRGIEILTGVKVETVEKKGQGVHLMLSTGKSISGSKVLICVGRSPNSRGFGIEDLGIECERGWIKVDRLFRTNIKNIYAAGDCIGGILLAHVASREGISAVESILGNEPSLDYNVVPNCIFTQPEIASVGLTTKIAKNRGINARSRKFLFSGIGKAHVIGEIGGFIKLVVDAATDKILGAQIIGSHATELVAELSLSIQFGITSEGLARVIHAHPTLSEAVQEASEAMHNRAIHSL